MTQQFKKNPNGGYLKPSNHGEGRETSVLEFTPELINELYRQSQQYGAGFVRANVSELKAGQYGNYRRLTMIPLQDQQVVNHQAAKSQMSQAPAQHAVPQPQMQTAPPPAQQPAYSQAPPAPPPPPALPQHAATPAPVYQQQPTPAPVQQAAPAAPPVGGDILDDEIPF